MSEVKLQAELFKKVWNELPQTRRLFFSIPNGGSRNKLEAMNLKATGLVAGQPDMCLIWKGKAYGFELKTDTGRLSDQQIKVHEAWQSQNTPVYIIRSVEQGFNIIKEVVS